MTALSWHHRGARRGNRISPIRMTHIGAKPRVVFAAIDHALLERGGRVRLCAIGVGTPPSAFTIAR